MQNKFQELYQQVTGIQNLYNNTAASLQHEGHAAKKDFLMRLKEHNYKVSQGINSNPEDLIKADERLDEERNKRIATLHRIISQLNPSVEKFMLLYDSYLLDGLTDRSLEQDTFLQCLCCYRDLINSGNNIMVYQGIQAQKIRRAIKKYLDWPANIVQDEK